MPLRFFIALPLALTLIAGCNRQAPNSSTYRLARTPAPANISRGRTVYVSECAACHGREGTGGQIGPSLSDEHTRRSLASVRAIILDPEPPMPKLFPAEITQSDVRDVAAYVESL